MCIYINILKITENITWKHHIATKLKKITSIDSVSFFLKKKIKRGVLDIAAPVNFIE